MSWYGIWTLKVLGLAKKIKVEPLATACSGDFTANRSRLTRTIARDSKSAGAD